MSITKLDVRQSISKDTLQQLLPYLSGQELDNLLRSIDSDLSALCRMDASNPADLTVTVQSSNVSNSESNRQRSMGHINNVIPDFVSGTIVFPATTGGTIVVTPGADVVLTIPPNQYVKVLVSLDAFSQLVVTPGTPDVAESAATVPTPVANTQAIGYITLYNNAGTISNIAQNKIYQFSASGGGGAGGGSSAGFSQEVSVLSGATSITVTFPSPLPGASYVVTPQLVNTVDGAPQFQTTLVTNKTNTGFTAIWSDPTDSANYKLAYIVPAVQMQVGEASIPNGASSLVVTLPISFVGTTYSAVVTMANLVDGTPQFQPTIISNKTASTFTVTWNAPTDTANYRLSYHAAEFQ